MKKGAFSKSRRLHLYVRDGARCQYCGVMVAPNEATVDHVIPSSLGGSADDDNLLIACRTCNCAKQDRSVEWLRAHRAFRRTPYAGVITLSQYQQLAGIGVPLEPMPEVTFHFERGE